MVILFRILHYTGFFLTDYMVLGSHGMCYRFLIGSFTADWSETLAEAIFKDRLFFVQVLRAISKSYFFLYKLYKGNIVQILPFA